ncbi:hypothetical protein [Pseudomonas sp.]|uniref:hypothetical protein n=1 Tax=Pseudomonas sp. TaxID=306 RepID=UPI001B0A6762|nr:hypothetical protein [Pseudomonas sp.]MBO9551314.1 hypothetical protein [Pseudomonas sp.]
MQRVLLCTFGTILLCLFNIGAWAMTGPETADALNLRIADTPEQCAANQPDYACSGVLARPLTQNHPRNFWEHDAAANQRGSELFVYLRSDIPAAPLNEKTGYILMNRFEALAQDKLYDVSVRPQPETVEVNNWDVQQAKKVPIQALYYRLGAPGALWRGQRNQLAWYQATGEWLPLLRYLPDDALTPFGFAQQEQLFEGYAVASRINARFADTAPTCTNGTSRYNCNGVWVRTTDVGSFRAWNVSPSSIKGNGVSFSYFAADMHLTKTYKTQGFIMLASGIPVRQPLTLRCVYPYDNGTSGSTDMCTFKGTCAALGIASAQQWLNRYGKSSLNECSFGTDATSFATMSELRSKPGISHLGWNELIMAAWPSNIPASLPLEAFIYSVNSHVSGQGLTGGQRFQREYHADTGTGYLPLLRFDPAAPNGQLVVYRPEDQNIE